MCISRICCLMLFAIFASAVVVGCHSSSSTSSENAGDTQATDTSNEADAEITAALAELSEEDRLAAAAQKFCAVELDSRLGSMGAPFKLMIEGQPVFLCCEGCKDAAVADPKATLASVQQLKAANSPGGPSELADPE